MKKYTAILLLLLITSLSFGQSKEKVKGSKTVTVEQKEIGHFDQLEIDDNLEVYLEKGDKNKIKIEADENLHEIISFDLRDNTLRIYTSKEAASYKKLILRITYTDDLKMVTSKNEAVINAISAIQLDNITFTSFDFSKLYLNVDSKNFTLKSSDKTKIELNLKSEKAKIELSKNSQLKALINTVDLGCDLYQKSVATIEGEATNATLRFDNNSIFTGNKFTIKNGDLTAESYTVCSIYAETNLIISAADKSEIELLGTPKIEMKKFIGEAKLIKKLK